MTLLIKNVMIVGGDRDFPEKSDVFVANDKISAIGNFSKKSADTVIDGQGAYLSPGFIDTNTDSDHYLTLFDHPGQDDFLRQGVTTIFGGLCGSSLAPLLYGGLESIRKWTNPDGVNVNWHTMAEFLAVLEKRPLAVNFGTFAGHSTVRRAIVGDAIRDLTKNELAVLMKTLEGAMEDGAFGVSTGLEYVHARKTPYAELKAIAALIEKHKGVYATHLRSTGVGVGEAVNETIKLAKETNVSTIVSHFFPGIGVEKEYQEALGAVNALPDNVRFHFDIYPSENTLFPVYTFLPAWVQTGGIEVMLENIKDEWLLPRLLKDMAPLNERDFFVASAPGNEFLTGKSLRDLMEMYGVTDAREALVRFMIAVGMRATVLYKSINPYLIKEAMVSKRSFIASNAPSFGHNEKKPQMKSERTTSTFSQFLDLVEKHNLMPLKDAIRKITLDPARTFGLVGRGQIKEGNFADLACFKGGEIRFTVVNGVVVQNGGQIMNTFPGKVLRHPSA